MQQTIKTIKAMGDCTTQSIYVELYRHYFNHKQGRLISVGRKYLRILLDDDHIIFGEIRSPNTVKNLADRPTMEINFVDPFARKGFRAKGQATFLPRGSAEFDALLPRFAQWGALTDKFNGIVKLRVERALPVISPAYDIGADEAELRETWMAHFSGLQPK